MDVSNRQFDAVGNKWTISIPIGLARKIKQQCGHDLPTAWKNNWAGLGQLLSDPWAYLDVLWTLVEEAAASRQVTRDQFEAAFDEQVTESSAEALRWAIVGFIPAGQRTELLAAVKLQQMAEKRIASKIDDPATQTAVDEAVDKVVAERLAAIGELIPGGLSSGSKPS